jgi:hypothetical protein
MFISQTPVLENPQHMTSLCERQSSSSNYKTIRNKHAASLLVHAFAFSGHYIKTVLEEFYLHAFEE